ncbi:sodium channel subunit beta-3 isoform X1 [Callorhinchus milii]|nr:sodium channel subunit beta-3 isoform X1 [Callorhinchus milii]XP_007894248.2 sodium channel subunit beta-3 isoform X1 [Callorhinchus milii]
MAPLNARIYSVPLAFILMVHCCWSVCVEVDSDTEAELQTNMKLTCISCTKREETETDTIVEWSYVDADGKDTLIYKYDKEPQELEGPFHGRLLWNGSKDLQDVSIFILNVTFNDSGLYRCRVTRYFNYKMHRPCITAVKDVQLTVHEDVLEDFVSYISQILMYVVLISFTGWLVIEMIYCYRRILRSEKAARDKASRTYLAIPSENTDHCTLLVEE